MHSSRITTLPSWRMSRGTEETQSMPPIRSITRLLAFDHCPTAKLWREKQTAPVLQCSILRDSAMSSTTQKRSTVVLRAPAFQLHGNKTHRSPAEQTSSQQASEVG